MNIFTPTKISYEDQISTGFCYLLNISEKLIGNHFLDIISRQSGIERISLGDFIQADFIGSNYITNHAVSKPDIEIITSKLSIFIENKVESPADSDQLLNHLKSIPRKSLLILLTKYSYKIDPAVTRSNTYLKPKLTDHFKWIDFESCFNEAVSTNPVLKKMISDFKATLHSEGIKGRSYNELSGSIYDDGTESQTQFLIDYCEVIKSAGWKASKFSREFTIRVNPLKFGKHFLINPRPYPSSTIDDQIYFYEQDLVHIFRYSDTDKIQLIQILEKFSKENPYNIKFINHDNQSEENILVGYLMIPLHFSIENKIDFTLLEKIWSELHNITSVLI